MSRTGSAIFVDTSIQIARIVHSPELKARIEERLKKYDVTTTGLVVRQEFKRRLLKEALYLLRQLDKRGSLSAVMRHVHDVLPPQQIRKQRICMQTLMTIFEDEDEESRSDRARLFLRSLLRDGLRDFDESVDQVVRESGCACGASSVRAKKRSFDFGADRCSRTGGDC